MRWCHLGSWAVVATLAAQLVPGTGGVARANGRLPNTTHVYFHPTDPNRILVAATYGLLVSTDGGCSFSWICENAVTPDGFSGADPSVLWAANGAITVVSFNAVSVSHDDGCTWEDVAGFADNPNLNLVEVAGHAGRPDTWYVVQMDYIAGNGAIVATQDGGSTYAPLPLSVPNIYWQTVRAAPSQPTRLYASGANRSTFDGPIVAVSDDAGATWRNAKMPVAVNGTDPLHIGAQQILAVHPRDANTFLLTVLDSDTSVIHLLRSTDGGQTGTLVQTISDGFRGMAFSDDGTTAWFATSTRIWRSRDAGQTFTLLPTPVGNAGVSRRGSLLFACGATASEGWVVGVSKDDGDTYAPLLLAKDLQGPFGCATGSSVQVGCPRYWALIGGPLGASLTPTTATRAGTCGVAAIAPESGGQADVAKPAPAAKKSGCGSCSAAALGPWAAAAAVGLGLRRWRRRRRAHRDAA